MQIVFVTWPVRVGLWLYRSLSHVTNWWNGNTTSTLMSPCFFVCFVFFFFFF